MEVEMATPHTAVPDKWVKECTDILLDDFRVNSSLGMMNLRWPKPFEYEYDRWNLLTATNNATKHVNQAN